MELDDFLKCKKVRCVDGVAGITTGKVYDVIGLDENYVHVTDDDGKETHYWYCRFEPVLEPAENPLQKMELTPEFESADPVLADNSVNIQDVGTDILDTNADIKDTHKFKVGDPVYWGLKSRIFKIYRFMSTNVLEVELDGAVTSVHKDELCPATLENYGKLCSLFERIDFEAPPKPLTGDELVRQMILLGIKNVLCFKNGTTDKVIIDRLCYEGSLMTPDCVVIGGVTPIDWYTGEPLTEAVLDE